MYHIFAPQGYRQDRARLRKYHPLRPATAGSPRLVEPFAAVFAGIGGVNQQVNLAAPGRRFDAFRTAQQIAGAGLDSKPIQRRLAKRLLGPLAEIGRDGDLARLERPGKRRLQLAVRNGLIELGAADGNPRPAAGRAGANVGSDGSIGPEREADQRVFRGLAPGEDAGPLGRVLQAFSGLIGWVPQRRPPHPSRACLRPRTNGRGRP